MPVQESRAQSESLLKVASCSQPPEPAPGQEKTKSSNRRQPDCALSDCQKDHQSEHDDDDDQVSRHSGTSNFTFNKADENAVQRDSETLSMPRFEADKKPVKRVSRQVVFADDQQHLIDTNSIFTNSKQAIKSARVDQAAPPRRLSLEQDQGCQEQGRQACDSPGNNSEISITSIDVSITPLNNLIEDKLEQTTQEVCLMPPTLVHEDKAARKKKTGRVKSQIKPIGQQVDLDGVPS